MDWRMRPPQFLDFDSSGLLREARDLTKRRLLTIVTIRVCVRQRDKCNKAEAHATYTEQLQAA